MPTGKKSRPDYLKLAQPDDLKEKVSLSKRVGAEILGTFALTFAAAGIDISAKLPGADVSTLTRMLCPALVVMAFIYSLGKISGAHFNPAVTFAFALKRAFPWKLVPVYLVAELAGAVLASLILRFAFQTDFAEGVNRPHGDLMVALVMEVVLTFLLVCTVLGTAEQHRLLGADAAIPVGAVIAAAGMIGLKVSGPSMNPARSLGPAIVAGDLSHLGLYLWGPLLGAALATGVIALVHVCKRDEESEAAQGS